MTAYDIYIDKSLAAGLCVYLKKNKRNPYDIYIDQVAQDSFVVYLNQQRSSNIYIHDIPLIDKLSFKSGVGLYTSKIKLLSPVELEIGDNNFIGISIGSDTIDALAANGFGKISDGVSVSIDTNDLFHITYKTMFNETISVSDKCSLYLLQTIEVGDEKIGCDFDTAPSLFYMFKLEQHDQLTVSDMDEKTLGDLSYNEIMM